MQAGTNRQEEPAAMPSIPPAPPEIPAKMAAAPPSPPSTSQSPSPAPDSEIGQSEAQRLSRIELAASGAPATAANEKPPAKASSSASTAAGVQLASYRAAKTAKMGWTALSKSHPDLFKDLNPVVLRVNLGPKKGIFYRLQTGPFAQMGAARQFCATLKEKNPRQGCIPIKVTNK